MIKVDRSCEIKRQDGRDIQKVAVREQELEKGL